VPDPDTAPAAGDELLPSDKGTYVLVLHLDATRRVTIARLGAFELHPGYYLYLGSAHGSGGLAARVGRHLEPDKPLHWHIDYLLPVVRPVEAWYTVSPLKFEKDWVDLLAHMKGVTPSVPRFGASDHRRGKKSHLFYARRRPSFGEFSHRVHALFGPSVLLNRASW
jgi:Uri superfamily endonuclease